MASAPDASAPNCGEQYGGLAFDHAQIGGFVGVGIVDVQQLQHLAFGDAVGGVGQDAHHLHAIQFHHQLEAARIEEVADQHTGRIAPQRVGGAAAAAQVGFVDHIVVQQGGGMDELDDRGQLMVFCRHGTAGSSCEFDQHRTQALAAGGNDVVCDLVDQDHIGCQPLADQGIHGGHVSRSQGLDLRQGQRGPGDFDGGHGSWRREVAEL